MKTGAIIGWKFNNPSGVVTRKGVITEWPDSLGPIPSDAQIAIWAIEYEEAQQEAQMIAEKARLVAEVRDRKEAVKQLKFEGKVPKHFDANGNRI